MSEAEPAEKCCAVLGFHKIGEPPTVGGWHTWNYIAEDRFAGYLDELARGDWQVLSLAEFVAAIDRPETLPPRSALLTFDDACRSVLTVAQPILERAGLPAVVFVPTAFVGDSNRFDEGCEPDEPICTWQELQELHAHEVAIQAHGVMHQSFSNLAPDEQLHELVESKASIEQHIAAPVEAFAFPFGDRGSDPVATAKLVRSAGYRVAFGYRGGVQMLSTMDNLAITRVAMGADTELAPALEEFAR